jgi:hypothetical protein
VAPFFDPGAVRIDVEAARWRGRRKNDLVTVVFLAAEHHDHDRRLAAEGLPDPGFELIGPLGPQRLPALPKRGTQG